MHIYKWSATRRGSIAQGSATAASAAGGLPWVRADAGRLVWLALLASMGLAVWASVQAGVLRPAAAASLLLLAPLTEELVFRAGLQQQLLRAGQPPLRAMLVTAAAFALLHGVWRGPALGLAVLAPAALLGLLYQRTGSLRACVALHAAMNLAWVLVVAPATTALGWLR